MSLASAAQPFNWNWVDNNGNLNLIVMGSVYDDTLGNLTLVAQVLMKSVGGGMYTGSFQGVQGHNYSVESQVYDDPEYTIPNPAFPPGGASFQCATIASQGGGGGGGGNSFVKGKVLVPPPKLFGRIQSNVILRGRIVKQQTIKTC